MYRLFTLTAMLTIITGCTVIEQILDGLPFIQDNGPPAGNDLPDDLNTPASLKAFESEAEFDEYFRTEITARNDRFSGAGGVGSSDDFLAVETDGDGAAPSLPGAGSGDRGDSAPVGYA